MTEIEFNQENLILESIYSKKHSGNIHPVKILIPKLGRFFR